MKNVRISVEVSRTVNLGNYESLKIQAGVSFDIPEGDNHEEHYRDAWLIAEGQVVDRIGMENQMRNKG